MFTCIIKIKKSLAEKANTEYYGCSVSPAAFMPHCLNVMNFPYISMSSASTSAQEEHFIFLGMGLRIITME